MAFLVHHGIMGQKWGKRNGPPYPLKGSDYSVTEKKYMGKKSALKNSRRNKLHFDDTLKEGTTVATLARTKDRTENTDMFYAAWDKLDRDRYMMAFNSPVKDTESGKNVYKFLIENKVAKDMHVASEDSAVEVFKSLVKNDRDFSNFIYDDNRMQSYFVDSRYKFKGYREARDALKGMRKEGHQLTDRDLRKVYRMFNYIIPFDGAGNNRAAKDVLNQRTKFFKELKKMGFGAVLDSNDALYGGTAAQVKSPIIVFDMGNIIPSKVTQTKYRDVAVSTIKFTVGKLLGG